MSILRGQPMDQLPHKSLVEAFDETANSCPNKPALIRQDGGVISFQQLQTQSHRVAIKLAELLRGRIEPSTTPNAVVLAMTPSTERIISILALWRLNLAYVPVENCVPKYRIKLIIREVKPVCVLANDTMDAKFQYQDVYCEKIGKVIKYEQLAAEKVENSISYGCDKDASCQIDSAACILYTSGSTGEPKGVVLSHGNILSRLQWQWREFPPQDDDVSIAKTSLLFVDSITEIWSALLAGKPVAVIEKGHKDVETLMDELTKHKVTRIVLVPSLLQALMCYIRMSNNRELLKHLRQVVCSGERLQKSLAEDFFNVFDGKLLMNFYGSTEVTGDATFDKFASIEDVHEKSLNGLLSIGTPIDGVTVRLEDEEGELVKDGDIGEIVVSGPTVMAGYMAKSELIDGGNKLYRTGDYGRLHNGNLIYEGRSDDQVKIRGNRINVNEVQKTLEEAMVDEQVFVMAMRAESQNAEVVAFVVGDESTEKKARTISDDLFPDYMKPVVVALEAIPTSDSTRKIDRQALKQIYKDNIEEDNDIDELSENAKQFLTILSEEISVPMRMISLQKEFRSLGGNSINKVSLASTLHDKNYKFSFTEFMAAETVGAMFLCCSEKNASETADDINMVDNVYEVFSDNNKKMELIKATMTAFTEKDPFVIACNGTQDEFYGFVNMVYETALEDNGLFYIVDTSKGGKFVGGMITFDPRSLTVPGDLSESLQLILEIVEIAEAKFKQFIPEGEHGYDYFTWATIPEMTAEENLKLTQLAEKFVVDIARERGYYAVHAMNISPVTQAVADELGYITAESIRLREYTRPDGSKPFIQVPPDYTIRAQIKILK